MPYARRSGTGWSSSAFTKPLLIFPVRFTRVAAGDVERPPLTVLLIERVLPCGLSVAPKAVLVRILFRLPVDGSTVYTSRYARPDITSRTYGVSSDAIAMLSFSASCTGSYGSSESRTAERAPTCQASGRRALTVLRRLHFLLVELAQVLPVPHLHARRRRLARRAALGRHLGLTQRDAEEQRAAVFRPLERAIATRHAVRPGNVLSAEKS